MFRSICFRSLSQLNKAIILQNSRVVDSAKKIHNDICVRSPRQTPKSNIPSPAIASKYQVITEENSPIIENTDTELSSYDNQKEKYALLSDEFDGINLERGKSGVFEIEDLVNLLQRENSRDIFVANVPREINYVDYMCIVSARSKRHVAALAEFVRKVYKKKRHTNDPIPRLEGKDSEGWIALDLGNIALHVFSESTRKVYDLETLWSVGPEYDEQMRKRNEITDIFENYSAYLKDLKPLA